MAAMTKRLERGIAFVFVCVGVAILPAIGISSDLGPSSPTWLDGLGMLSLVLILMGCGIFLYSQQRPGLREPGDDVPASRQE